MNDMDEETQIKLESQAWRDFIKHLQKRTDVQNIDLMTLSGFCRNCLYKWLLKAAQDQGIALSKEDAIFQVYGMTYEEWKNRYQTKATAEQLKLFEDTKPLHSDISGH